MMNLRTAFPPVPADFPNRLVDPSPERTAIGPPPLALLGLLVLCLLFRGIMAVKLASICPDGVLYIRVAKALDEGRTVEGFQPLHANVFPLVLLTLHRLGLDWELAGKLWGTLLSGLTVLPLYGWARRQFDGRIALVACFLYAVHKELIVWSPEVIREPTFWFLFMLSIYLLWRAITEVRLALFVSAGAAMALAASTRFEGLFLFIPLGLWSLWRWVALSSGRTRLVSGVLLGVVAYLALPVVVGLATNRHAIGFSGQSAAGYVQTWMAPSSASPPSETAIPTTTSTPPSQPIAWGRMVRVFVPTVVKGFTPVVGLLVLTGLWGWRRTWTRRDHVALGCLALVTFAAIWVHLSSVHVSCTRFVLQIVLISLPCAALGLLRWCEWLLPLAEGAPRRLRWAVLAGPWVLVLATGAGVALGSDCSRRRGEVNLGKWLRQEFAAETFLFGSDGGVQVVSFYSQGRCAAFPFDASDDAIVASAEQIKPDAVLLVRTKRMTPARCQGVGQRLKPLGFRQLGPSQMPADCDAMVLLVRSR